MARPQRMARQQEQGQRWRCLIPNCPTKGRWQFEPPGQEHLPSNHPNSHYMQVHYQRPPMGARTGRDAAA